MVPRTRGAPAAPARACRASPPRLRPAPARL